MARKAAAPRAAEKMHAHRETFVAMAQEVQAPPGEFRLVRHFAVTSLVGVLAVLIPLLYFYRDFATEALEKHQTTDNVTITRIFASTLWPRYADYVKSAHLLSPQQLRSDPHVAQIRKDVLQQMQGLKVVKVKIYDLHGMTVFSTDESQIGVDKADDDGVKDAIAGKVVSEIAFENEIDPFEKVVNDRNLISSYIPIRVNDAQQPEGVFEVYSDVTEHVNALNRASWEIVALVLGCMAVLYGFLYAIVRRADVLMAQQALSVQRSHQAMLEHAAHHDPLTGLPNRNSLTEHLTRLLAGVGDTRRKCVVLCLGLDGFKQINDSLGHQMGDAALVKVAKRLNVAFGDQHFVARMAGDEFAITMTGGDITLQVARLVHVVERLQAEISSQPIVANGHDVSITACVGIAIFPDDARDVNSLLQAADVALSHAKQEGRNRYRFHAAGMNSHALDMLLLERDLLRALEDKQFVMHYQPKVDLESGRITGAEALIRWQHPQRGLIGPVHFIRVAEERGLIVPMGEWVMQEVCRQNAEWQRAGMRPIPIAINLPADHFQKQSLPGDVRRLLRRHDLASDCLEIELTESSISRDSAATVSTMRQLNDLGVMLSLDDFGTGYSSLSQLKGLPLDNLKLDQSFVRGLPDDGDDLAMGKALGLNVIAEGVETTDQLAVLRELGCDMAQGYLFARPLSPQKFLDFMQEHEDLQSTAFSQL